MCGIPARALEQYVEKLRTKYDVTIASIDAKTGERQANPRRSVLNESRHSLEDGPGAEDDAQKPVLTVREILERYVSVIRDLVLADTAYQYACTNSDQENAYLEGNEAVKRAAGTIEDTVFLRLYLDNPTFHNRLHRDVLEETYPMLSRPQRELSLEDSSEPDAVPNNFELEYRQLSRLQADCEYFLGAGGAPQSICRRAASRNRSPKCGSCTIGFLRSRNG